MVLLLRVVPVLHLLHLDRVFPAVLLPHLPRLFPAHLVFPARPYHLLHPVVLPVQLALERPVFPVALVVLLNPELILRQPTVFHPIPINVRYQQ
jgi:hypothetical protein